MKHSYSSINVYRIRFRLFFIIFCFIFFKKVDGQVGTLTGTGMSICNLYSFSVCPNQTITPLNYGSQGYACTGLSMPDVSFTIQGGGWRVMKNNWFFSSTVNGQIKGYTSSGILQTIPFLSSNTITPLSYSGNFVQFAINGIATGSLLSQANFSISIDPVVFGANNYTYCTSTATSIAISPTIPSTGGPWTYLWQPGNITGNPVNVSPSANTIYTVIGTTSAGCSSTATVLVNINCGPSPLCSGTLGAPVFLEDFGSGSSIYGPVLPAGVTNYIYQTGPPPNGTYVISSSSNPSGINLGYVADGDHTGNLNGYMMVINSDYPASEVYRKHVTGLCQNTTYVFSSYLSNNNTPSTPTTVCPGYVYANVKLYIEYPLGTVQNSVTTGNLPLGLSNTALNWNQYGFAFTTLTGQTSVDIVLKNNAPGGCGNDYVVDDISLSPCGPGLALSIVPNQTVFCIGDTISLQSNFTSGGYSSPQYQWQNSMNGGMTWTNIVGATSANYNITSVSPSQAGMYQLVVAENGNINLSSCNIAVGPLTFSVSNGISIAISPTICSGSSASLIASGATSYTWSNGISSNSITVSPSSTTSYSVIGKLGTCTNTAVSTVTVVPNPIISFTPTVTSICAGQTANLTASGANTYTWNSTATLSNSTGSFVTSAPTATSFYTVIGTANTCTNSAVTTVSILPSPIITIAPIYSICQGAGSSAILVVSGANTYTWNSSPTLSSANANSVIATPNVTETYTVIGEVNTCTNSAVTTVSIIPTPTVIINSSSIVICPSTSVILNAGGASNYTWSPSSTLNSPFGTQVTALPNTTTTYSVFGTNGICTNVAQAQVVVTVTNNPIIVSNSSTICSSTSASLSAVGGLTYTWSPATNLNSAFGSNVVSTPLSSTVYTVSGSSPFGCIGSTSVSVIVVPTPTISISSNSLILCFAGGSSTLNAVGASSYTWSPAITLSNANTSTTVATPINTTTYIVTGSNGFSPNMCASSNTIQIKIGSGIIPVVSPNEIICIGQSTTIYAIGGNTYHWIPTIGVSEPNESATIVKPSSTTIYTVFVSNNNVCPVTGTVEVIVKPLPILYAGRDTTVNIDETITLNGIGNVPVEFISTSTTPLTCNFCSSITVNPQENTCYVLMGKTEFNCVSYDEVCVKVNNDWDIFIPNTFTPNSDGNNEYFMPYGYALSEINLIIFDRWGHELFKEYNTKNGWDGKQKGTMCKQGVYIYQVEVKTMSGRIFSKTGHVNLLPRFE